MGELSAPGAERPLSLGANLRKCTQFMRICGASERAFPAPEAKAEAGAEVEAEAEAEAGPRAEACA